SSLAPVAPSASPSFPTRRSSDLLGQLGPELVEDGLALRTVDGDVGRDGTGPVGDRQREDHAQGEEPAGDEGPTAVEGEAAEPVRSEEHTSELQSRENLVCRLLLE